MKALVVGYGKAGMRHVHFLEELEITCDIVDPFVRGIETISPNRAFRADETYAFVVIASPPKTHLHYIREAAKYNIPILCEKPLCGWGQLDEAKALRDNIPLMMAFNYRFHPDWVHVQKQVDVFDYTHGMWVAISREHIPNIPTWGLLLDRAPHTLDQLQFLSGCSPIVTHAHTSFDTFRIEGSLGEDRFFILKQAIRGEAPFRGILTPLGWVEPNEALFGKMFLDMYAYFLDNLDKRRFVPGLQEGIFVQEGLEAARRLSHEFIV